MISDIIAFVIGLVIGYIIFVIGLVIVYQCHGTVKDWITTVKGWFVKAPPA